MTASSKRWAGWLAVPAVPAVVAGGLLLLCAGLCVGVPCVPTGLRYGLWLDECPAGRLRLSADVHAQGLVRQDVGTVRIAPSARYVLGDGASSSYEASAMHRGVSASVVLLDNEGQAVAGFEAEPFRRERGELISNVRLPALPDGDYVLRATVTAPFEDVTVDVPLALYAPALVHAITDRPLYKPGQDVLLRSVMLRRTDLSPLDGRPGRWRIVSPSGDEMLVEKDKAGPWGVADTSFPLDARAEIGTWRAIWESGAASDAISFEVRPFRLPRFTVEVAAVDAWYGAGDEIVLEGTARYGSGAPVASAPVEVRLSASSGRWPPPLAWEEPFRTRTDAAGRFRIVVGEVPADVLETATLTASARVVEAAGEIGVAAGTIVVSEHPIVARAVTELGDGLVGGFNNRAYVRVTTPDGRPFAKAEVAITPWWDAEAEPIVSTTDEDGVAAVQIDPGDPVTVVIDAPPFRPRPMVPQRPALVSAIEVLGQRSLDLPERRALDGVTDDVAACGDLTNGAQVAVGVRVDAGGAVRRVVAGAEPVERCVADAMRRVRFPAGTARTYAFTWQVPDSLRPSLHVANRSAVGADGVATLALGRAAAVARRCVPRGAGLDGAVVARVHWAVAAGDTSLDVLADSTGTSGLAPGQEACVRQAFSTVRLDAPAPADAMGSAEVRLSVPSSGESRPQDTTKTGYQLRVAVRTDGTAVGDAPLVLDAGAVPPLRIRATPTLVRAGDEVTFELFRGPSWSGGLPERLTLYEGSVAIASAPVDTKTRAAKIRIPDGPRPANQDPAGAMQHVDGPVDGFFTVDAGGARAIVFARPVHGLDVALTSDRPTYRPGETATLTITTTDGGAPTAAGVGLIGVDATLAQLAPLPGPDAYGRVTVRAAADRPAFDVFDPKALMLGQVRGDNAARAAVLRLTSLPDDPAGDERLWTYGRSAHHDEEELTAAFYRALARLTADVAAWEQHAAAGEQMTNERMVEMWSGALAALRQEGAPAIDAFGRELTLDALPGELLAQVDPRQVVADATRLPEDVVAWDRYVAEEVR